MFHIHVKSDQSILTRKHSLQCTHPEYSSNHLDKRTFLYSASFSIYTLTYTFFYKVIPLKVIMLLDCSYLTVVVCRILGLTFIMGQFFITKILSWYCGQRELGRRNIRGRLKKVGSHAVQCGTCKMKM